MANYVAVLFPRQRFDFDWSCQPEETVVHREKPLGQRNIRTSERYCIRMESEVLQGLHM